MAADKVEVVTQSYSDPSKTISWTCNETGEYEIEDGERSGRGTDVIMYITKDSEEYLSYWRIKEILEKYCNQGGI
jgi:molecular chaperone HtpG